MFLDVVHSQIYLQICDVFDSTLYNNSDDDYDKKMKAAAKIKAIWKNKKE